MRGQCGRRERLRSRGGSPTDPGRDHAYPGGSSGGVSARLAQFSKATSLEESAHPQPTTLSLALAPALAVAVPLAPAPAPAPALALALALAVALANAHVLEQDTPSAADKEPAVFLDGSLVRGMASPQP